MDVTNGPVVFQRGSEANAGIAAANPDGGNRTGLVTTSSADSDPAVSFDGTELAFVRTEGGDADIYVSTAEGRDEAPLTDVLDTLLGAEIDRDPAWQRATPGTIAWSRGGDIWVIQRDGGNPHQITFGPAIDEHPSWSPDGNQIVFSRTGSGLYTVDLVTGAVELVTGVAAGALDPDWGPGGQIVYSAPGGGALQIWRGDTQLTSGGGDKRSPVVSPDTTRIAYAQGADIVVVTAKDATKVGTIDGASDPGWGRLPGAAGERPDAGDTLLLHPLGQNDTAFEPGSATIDTAGPPETVLRDRVEVEALVSLEVPEKVRVDARIAGGGRTELTLREGEFTVRQDRPGEAPSVEFAPESCPNLPTASAAGYGRAEGRSRMRNRWGTGGTRGTVWTIDETCERTIVTVIEGEITFTPSTTGAPIELDGDDPPLRIDY